MSTPSDRVLRRLARPLPLIRYLVLATETHAFSGSLAFFALLGFYPASSLLLSLSRYILQWDLAQAVLLEALADYYPQAQEFLVRNLEATVARHGRDLIGSIVWILLGAAGIFMPLEAAFNRIWNFPRHRPYWKNQLVGFLLTAACALLATAFVLVMASIYWLVERYVPPSLLADLVRHLSLHVAAPCFAIVALFLFYRFLPNGPVTSTELWPAAVVAGLAAELMRWLYQLVLPIFEVQKNQGPFYVSISFVLLAYFEAFVVLAGAYLAAGAGPGPAVGAGSPGAAGPAVAPSTPA
jgi:uncharacterized BrkB/YihY/UPF0761 family membrane protein